MATMYAKASGEIIRFLRNAEQEQERPAPPPGTADTLAFDSATNREIVLAYDRDCDSLRLSGGVLRRNGVPMTVNPPGRAYQDRQRLPDILAQLGGPVPLVLADRQALDRILARAAGWTVPGD